MTPHESNNVSVVLRYFDGCARGRRVPGHALAPHQGSRYAQDGSGCGLTTNGGDGGKRQSRPVTSPDGGVGAGQRVRSVERGGRVHVDARLVG